LWLHTKIQHQHWGPSEILRYCPVQRFLTFDTRWGLVASAVLYVSPAYDAATTPHEGDASVVEVPAVHSCSLSQQHEALRVWHNLGRVQSLHKKRTQMCSRRMSW
jgi:hypothetical protein